MDGVVPAVRRPDRPRRARVAAAAASACCSGPCGTWCRWGARAAGRPRRSPWRRSRRAAWPRCAACPRPAPGGPSGQPGPPRSAGRTHTRSRTAPAPGPPARAAAWTWSPGRAAGTSARIAVICGVLGRGEPVPGRQPAVAQPRDQRAQRGAGRGRAARRPAAAGSRRAARSNSSAPSASISSTSWPAGILMAASWCQLRDRVGPRLDVEAPQALARSRSRPRPSGRCPGRARASATSGLALPVRISQHHAGAEMPCPSRKTVALTWKVSPATALAGRRPQSTAGWTSRIGIRPITPATLPSRGRDHASVGGR